MLAPPRSHPYLRPRRRPARRGDAPPQRPDWNGDVHDLASLKASRDEITARALEASASAHLPLEVLTQRVAAALGVTEAQELECALAGSARRLRALAGPCRAAIPLRHPAAPPFPPPTPLPLPLTTRAQSSSMTTAAWWRW